MDESVGPVLDHLDRHNPGGIIGVYLYGSAASSGLTPDSDIDLLVLTRRSLDVSQRAALVSLLLDVSGWRGHAERFPDAAHRRPIELTSVVVDEEQSRHQRPRQDFQYGEWLREDFINGHVPQPVDSADVVILLATAQSAHLVLRGAAFEHVVAPVPRQLLRTAVLDIIPGVLDGVEGDERNALLTLARVLVTLDTGEIVSKSAAAEAIMPTLAAPDRDLLERALAGYVGTFADDWTGLSARVRTLCRAFAARADRYRPGGTLP